MTVADAPILPPISPLHPPRFGNLVDRIKSIGSKRIVWVMGDQAVVSVGNFLTFNLIARSLPAAQYGAFGVILETVLFLNSLQSALVIYPMTVEGATGGARRLQRLVVGSILLTIPLLPLLGGLTGAATLTSSAWPVACCAIFAMFMWQLQETTRRALMADLRFRSMLLGDGISYIGQALVVFLLTRTSCLSLQNVFLTMGLTSLLAAAVQAIQLRARMPGAGELRAQARSCWRMGRWMLLSNLGGIVTSLGYMWTLRLSHGLEAVAAFTALFAVTKPANPVATSLCGIITPAVARVRSSSGSAASTRVAMKYALLGCAIVAPPFAVVFCAPAFTLKMLYGTQSPYIADANLLRIALLDYGMMYISYIAGAWLAGLGQSRSSCAAQYITVAATASIALPATILFGVPGLLWGALIALACGAASAIVLLIRFLKTQDSAPAHKCTGVAA